MDQGNPALHPSIEIAAFESAIAAGATFPPVTVLNYDGQGFSVRSTTSALDYLKAQLL